MYTVNNTKHLSLKCFPKLILEDPLPTGIPPSPESGAADTWGNVPQARDMAVNTNQKEGSQEHTPALTGRLEMAVLIA